MTRLIDFELDAKTNTTILVEASDDGTPKGQQRVSAGGAVTEKASESFEAALATIKPIARTILTQMREATADAQEIQIEIPAKGRSKVTTAPGPAVAPVPRKASSTTCAQVSTTPPGASMPAPTTI